MSAKRLPKRILYVLPIALIVIMIIAKRRYESKSISGHPVYKQATEVKTLADVKHQYIVLFDKEFDNTSVTAAFIEYSYNNSRNALIIRRDSFISLIDNYNTEVTNVHNNMLQHYSDEVFEQLENGLLMPVLQKKPIGGGIIKNRGIKLSLKLNGNHTQYIYVTPDNFELPEVREICIPIIKLLSIMHNSDITLENLIPEKTNKS